MARVVACRADEVAPQAATFVWAPLLGHEQAREILGRAVAEGRAAQACLFSGPESVGKRETALWLAALLNCDHRAGLEPCLTCMSCKKFGVGSHPDWVEFEPEDEKKRLIGVEPVRAFLKKAQFAPTDGRWKVFVLPEAHRLTEQAQNCLLKALEEPSPGHVFVLCTSSHAKLLPTILSRCQTVRFTPVEAPRIAEWLVGQGFPQPRAGLAATLSEGRPGHARRLAGDAKVWELRAKVLQDAASLARADEYDAMELAERLEPQRGTNDEKRTACERAFQLFSSWFRDLACLQRGLDEGVLINQDHRDALREAAGGYTQARLVEALRALQEARGQLFRNANLKLMLSRLTLRLRGDRR